MRIARLEVIEVRADRCLVAFYGCYTGYDRVDVEELGRGQVGWDSRRMGSVAGGCRIMRCHIYLSLSMFIPLLCLLLPLYKTKQIRLTSMEIRMFEIPEFSFGIGFEYALLEVGDFVESVHVELAHE